MSIFSVLTPEATVNYIKNPALRYDTTDWNAQGSTITRVLTRARFGVASLQVVTAGSALREGAYFRVSALTGVSEPITVSAYVRGTGKVRIRLDNNVIGGAEYASQPIELTDSYWQRISMTGFSTGGNDLRLYVETDEGTAKARTFYVDGAQLERKAYPTSYCDGDQPGCRWDGLYHGSTSQREAKTRAGGKWVELATDRENEDLYMTVVGGLGMAPLTNNTQPFALQPGGYFSNRKTNMRVVTITFHAKHLIDETCEAVSLQQLHELRQFLIDIVKPDLTGGDESIWFRYDDGEKPVYFQARYDGGLEGEWDIRNQFFNTFPLRLLAENPSMVEDSQEVSVLDVQDTIYPNMVMGRVNGRWNILNYGVGSSSGTVQALAAGPRGELYAVGTFVTANANAAAVDPLITVNGIAKWDGEKWSGLGGGAVLGVSGIKSLAVGLDGKVYVTGMFTTIGGVAANRVAYWDGNAWNAMGTGLSGGTGIGQVVVVAPNGWVYVGGNFTSAGGVSCAYIAYWDGLQWRRLGQYGGLNDSVSTMAFSPDGSILYVGGNFTDQNGNPGSGLTRVTQYNLSTGLFSAMGSGFNGNVSVIVVNSGNTVYAGGNFTASGSTSIAYVARWNNSQWEALSGGNLDNYVPDMALMDNGNLLLVGDFDNAGDVRMKNATIWNGSTFVNLDVQVEYPNGNDFFIACLVAKNGDIFIGGQLFSGTGNIRISGRTTITCPGSAAVKPLIYFKGPGRVRWLENQTTRTRMYLDLNLANNEEVFLDIAKGSAFSTTRGSVFYDILPGSDFGAFELVPGENIIHCFIVDDVGAVAQLGYTPQHWGVDATG